MKRRFLSLVLCALMLTAAFLVGCGERSEEEIIADIAANAKQPYTVTLWIPTNDTTTPEAVQMVEDAINEILRKDFSTEIDLHAIKDSEYEAAVSACMDEIQALLDAGATPAKSIMDTKVANKDVTVIKTEEGTYETVYPAVENTQMDIFLTRSQAEFEKYAKAGQLASLQAYLDGSYSNLAKVIYPTLFELTKYNGATYGIPVNHAIGEYTLIVIDKALADTYNSEYEADVTTATTLADLKEFIAWAGEHTTVALSAVKEDLTEDDQAVFTELPGTSDTAAVRVVKGDFVDLENYRKDSYVIKYQMPVATAEDAFSSMFVISTYSVENSLKNPRAMEVLEFINTDVEIKTLLQYGIEGVHYKLNYAEDDASMSNPTLEMISDDYSMNTLYTGNVYKSYRAEGVTMADSWVTAKEQNLDSK
ncbi:MAG: hypothetical protein IJY12_00480 [Clostridia bacterium]|nr:hypothetical protein [Clostridia bacterium]